MKTGGHNIIKEERAFLRAHIVPPFNSFHHVVYKRMRAYASGISSVVVRKVEIWYTIRKVGMPSIGGELIWHTSMMDDVVVCVNDF